MTSSTGPVQVSVVIPCFNAGDTLGKLLTHLSQQTLAPERYEIIVVDDGSTDHTVLIAQQFENVRLLRQTHQGPGVARTQGGERARGGYVLYLDSDLDVPQDLLERHLEFHLSHPQIAATGGSVIPDRRLPLFSWALTDHLSSWFNVHPGVVYHGPPEYFPSLNFCVNKRTVIDQCHLTWEAGLEHTGEDVVFCHALRQRGQSMAFVPEAKVKHHDRDSFRGYLRHMVRWGHHAPFVRGRLPGLKYGFLFPRRAVLLIFTLPLIIFGYTLLLWKSWLSSRPLEVTVSLPQIFVGRLAYAWGVIRGTLARNRLNHLAYKKAFQ